MSYCFSLRILQKFRVLTQVRNKMRNENCECFNIYLSQL